jgi:hypothetical protein
MTSQETDQIRLIAKTLDLQYFAVDYLRREGDDSPVFVDVNVYPGVISKFGELGRKLGYYGRWHTLENDARWLSLNAETHRAGSEAPERLFWNVFDDAMLAFLEKETDSKR